MVRAAELGPLEMEVLGLFDAGSPASVAELRGRLKKKLAYTTVMTVVARLHAKGLLVREKEGPRFLYSPAARAPAVKGGIFARMRRALFPDGDVRPLVALVEEEDALSDGELRELRAAIDRRLREGGATRGKKPR